MFSENLSQEDQQDRNENEQAQQAAKEEAKKNTFRPSISENSKRILERKKQKEMKNEEGRMVSARAVNKQIKEEEKV